MGRSSVGNGTSSTVIGIESLIAATVNRPGV
jgi:hypothetical protein